MRVRARLCTCPPMSNFGAMQNKRLFKAKCPNRKTSANLSVKAYSGLAPRSGFKEVGA